MRALLVLLLLAGCVGEMPLLRKEEEPTAEAKEPPHNVHAAPPAHLYRPPSYGRSILPPADVTRGHGVETVVEEAVEERVAAPVPAPAPAPAPMVAVTCPTVAPSITYNCMSPPCPGPPPVPPPSPWWEDQMKIVLAAISGGIGMVLTAVASRLATAVKKAKA